MQQAVGVNHAQKVLLELIRAVVQVVPDRNNGGVMMELYCPTFRCYVLMDCIR